MINKFNDLLLSTKREGMVGLITWLRESGFYDAPCSSGNHLAKEGGLLEHSINVYNIMHDLYENIVGKSCKIQRESIVICALLHDLGKCGDFGKPAYIENWVKDGRPTKAEPEQKYKRSETKPFTGNPDLMYVPHEIRSISIASRFINLTEEEYFAILYHNGLYGDLKYAISGKETPLYLLLHMADMWSSRVVEADEKEEQPE